MAASLRFSNGVVAQLFCAFDCQSDRGLRLFGDGESTEPTARMARLESQKSVLDYVTASLTRLQGTLGAGDKRKLSATRGARPTSTRW